MAVRLEPMSEEEFGHWRMAHTKDYAEEKVTSGAWSPEEAPRLAEETYTQLLPQGLQTPDQFLYTAIDDGTGRKVGHIWFTKMTHGGQTFAFIYDIIIFEEYRRQGYGEQTMLAIEDKVREQGLNSIALHVFGHNHAAAALYQKIGYEITDLNMMKQL